MVPVAAQPGFVSCVAVGRFIGSWRGTAGFYPDEGRNAMSLSADGSQAAPFGERPTRELVKDLSEQVSALVREELKLAQVEMTRKGKQTGVGAAMLGGGGLIALYGLGCLIACAILAISQVLAAWLAALIVGVALLAVAGAAALLGKGRLRKATPPVPKQAVDSVKTDVEVIKERARR
jgi:Putative Actinobacterial Holin-X, holin superfamily III